MKKDLRSPNYKQLDLPEGAKARLGTGYLTGKIVYSPNGNQLVVPKSTGIWVYDASTLEIVDIISEYRAFNSSIDNAVGFGSDGKLFAVTVAWGRRVFVRPSETYMLRIWSKETEEPALIYIECSEKMDSMFFCPDGRILAGSKNGTIYLWDVHTGKLQNTFTLGAGKIKSIVFSPDGSTLASRRETGTGQFIFSESGGETYETIDISIDVWDTRTSRHKFTLYANSLSGFSPDGQMLAVKTEDGVALWEVNTGICKFDFGRYPPSVLYSHPTTHPDSYTDTPGLGSATSLAFSPDGITLASYNRGVNKIQLWNYHTGNCKSTFTGIDRITSLVFSPDGCALAGGCKDGTVLLWDVDSSIDETALTDDNPFVISESNIDNDSDKNILTAEEMAYQDRESQIKQICEERGIITLCHFTRIEHLQNILQEGLLGRSLLETRKPQPKFNDPDRFDEHRDASCLSISFPNFQLFNKFGRPTENSSPDYSEWAVLLLKAEVIWELDCAFCRENAASRPVRNIPLKEKRKPYQLENMFTDAFRDTNGDSFQRSSPRIPNHYPTHPQAEVLVFAPIPVKYFKEVHFYNETALEQWCHSNPGNYPPKFSVNQRYFQYG